MYTPATPNNISGSATGSITCPNDYQILYRYTIGGGPLPWTNVPDLAIGYGLSFSNGLPGDIEVRAGWQTLHHQ